MKYDKPNLEQRVRDVLDANFPEWIWNLKPGSKIAVYDSLESWTRPGQKLWCEKVFICISGNCVWFQDLTTTPIRIRSTPWADAMITMEEYEKIEAELMAYRKAHPNWENEGM